MNLVSQSLLLQALGWAALNSFWQVGLLWCGFVLCRRFGYLSPGRQFGLAVFSLGLGLAAFVLSFWLYLQPGGLQRFAPRFFDPADQQWLPLVLSSASVTYLLLLAVPAARLVQNWRFLRRLRRSSLHKAPVQYRLFVRQAGAQLGLRRPVRVLLSGLVSSPVTIGFLKPLILLPVASFNQLSLRQAEAILLHELAHIRRADFLVNIGITFTQTILYFNPFVRLFVQAAEASRECSCDGLVLQFEYDRLAYASALLQLEKSARPQASLALGATGKHHFMARIQGILGISTPQPRLQWHHFSGLLASLLCLFALHSFLISGSSKSPEPDALQALAQYGNPFHMAFTEGEPETFKKKSAVIKENKPVPIKRVPLSPTQKENGPELVPDAPLPSDAPIVLVSQKETASTKLSAEENKKVETLIQSTQKVLSEYEWQQLETAMADGLTSAEKAQVRQQYQAELQQIDWNRMKENLAQNYSETDLEKVQIYLSQAQEHLQRDSLVKVYSAMLHQMDSLSRHTQTLPLPDLSTDEVEKLKIDLRKVRDSLIIIQARPLIKL